MHWNQTPTLRVRYEIGWRIGGGLNDTGSGTPDMPILGDTHLEGTYPERLSKGESLHTNTSNMVRTRVREHEIETTRFDTRQHILPLTHSSK